VYYFIKYFYDVKLYTIHIIYMVLEYTYVQKRLGYLYTNIKL